MTTVADELNFPSGEYLGLASWGRAGVFQEPGLAKHLVELGSHHRFGFVFGAIITHGRFPSLVVGC